MSTENASPPASDGVLNRAIKKFERGIVVSLVLMMMLVVTLSTLDLGWLIARDNILHVEIVLEVALIAIARKVIVLDLAKYDGLQVLGLAALIIALALAFLLQRGSRARRPTFPWATPPTSPPTSSQDRDPV